MASGFEMRVGDAEREATATELREHYASGRLTLDELNERLDKAFAAKTRGDLNSLMVDLPSARPRAGAGGPAGARPLGAGQGTSGQGPGSGWGPGTGWSPGAGWGASAGRQAGRAVGTLVSTFVVICALVLVGTLGVFGIGTGRPIGIILIVAALALLRRLLFRRRVRACGPRRRW